MLATVPGSDYTCHFTPPTGRTYGFDWPRTFWETCGACKGAGAIPDARGRNLNDMPTDPLAYQKRAIRTATHKVPLCGCGNTETMWGIVKAVLERNVPKNEPYDPNDRRPGCYDPMPEFELSSYGVEFAAQVLSETGFTEHGSSVGYGWLTGAGRLLLLFLRKYGTRGSGGLRNMGDTSQGYWPIWADSCDPTEDTFEITAEEWRNLADAHSGYENDEEWKAVVIP